MKYRFQKNKKGELVPSITRIEGASKGIALRKKGYEWVADGDSDTLDAHLPRNARDAVLFAMFNAFEVLKEHRIFDVNKWLSRRSELTPDAEAAIDVLDHGTCLMEAMDEGETDEALLLAMELGGAMEQMAAQTAWRTRNPPPSAAEAIQAKVSARRHALADYILRPEGGERPDKRPGQWYDGFRELYPQHAARDKTLKADYPHALKMSRKTTGGKGA